MKNIHKIYILFIWAILGISCVGQKEEISQGNLKIIANKEAIQLGQDESVCFQVFLNELEITEDCEVFIQIKEQDLLLEEPLFTPQEPGTFYFYALYKGIQTSSIGIQVLPDEAPPQGNFYRRALITKFTATWCVNCPKMSEAIETVKQNNPNRIIDMAVHYIDELEVNEGKKLANQFSVSAIPVTVVNLSHQAQTSISSSTILQNYITEVFDNEYEASGIKIDSYEEGGLLHVDIETTIASEGEYRLVIALVQDEIKMTQTGAGADYIHHSVLKGMLQQNMEGEELGKCSQGEILTYHYQHPVRQLDAQGKYRLIVYILNKNTDGSYIVNNVITCNVKEKTNYQYEQ